MNLMTRFRTLTLVLALSLAAVNIPATPAPDAPVRGIMDNSFLVEEAYNQEPGVVQHIFTAVHAINHQSGPDDRLWDMAFTQEWPLFSQTHQVSYTVPYYFAESGGQSDHGFGSILLNYRWQALFDEETLLALAPRFSLVLPTSEAERGMDEPGYQLNLPFSTALNDHWFVHANAGITFLPEVGSTTKHDLETCNLGASAIYAPADRFHLMLEWVGLWAESSAGTGTDHDFTSLISPGARYAFNYANDSQLVLGLAVPIGLNETSPEVGVFFYVSFENGFLSKKQK
jgi:hypothetical protein